MIFIAGVSPKKKVLDQNPRRCPVCGLNQATYQRVDHYLSLFFIPLVRVKKGDPFVLCDRCGQSADPFGPDVSDRQHTGTSRTCGNCGRDLDRDFKYCPHCGQRV